tara:strand:+ start:1060 stop:1290 length:231 start_codon:yes stop_codon:yes gene_type:complete
MAEYFEVKTMKKDREGKERGHKIGAMFPWKSGKGFNIVLDSVPLPKMNDNGELECVLMVSKPYDKNKAPFTDDIPF